MKRHLRSLYRLLNALAKDPRMFNQVVNTVPSVCSAYGFSRAYIDTI